MIIKTYDLSLDRETLEHDLNNPRMYLTNIQYHVEKEKAMAVVELRFMPCEEEPKKYRRSIRRFFSQDLSRETELNAIIGNKKNEVIKIETTQYEGGTMIIVDYRWKKGG